MTGPPRAILFAAAQVTKGEFLVLQLGTITVAVVEGQILFGRVLQELLESDGAFRIVDFVESVSQLHFEVEKPDVVVIDYDVADVNLESAMRQINRHWSGVPVCVPRGLLHAGGLPKGCCA